MSDAQALSDYMAGPSAPSDVRKGYETLLSNYRHLLAEEHEYNELTGALTRVLVGVANILKGDPGSGAVHNWSDLTTVAKDVLAERDWRRHRTERLVEHLLNVLLDLEGEAREAGVYPVIAGRLEAVYNVITEFQ